MVLVKKNNWSFNETVHGKTGLQGMPGRGRKQVPLGQRVSINSNREMGEEGRC